MQIKKTKGYLILFFLLFFLVSCGNSVIPNIPASAPNLTVQSVFNAIMRITGIANPFQYTEEESPLELPFGTEEFEFSLDPSENTAYTVNFQEDPVNPSGGKYDIDLSGLEEGKYQIEITASEILSSSRLAKRESSVNFWLEIREEAEEQNIYYISPTGNDASSGSAGAPWRTPYLSVQKLNPGDTLIFLEGEYLISSFDHIMVIPSGTAGNPITLKGIEGEKPVIRGENNLYSSIILSDVEYIQIENLEFTSAEGEFFREAITGVDEPISHIVLKDLYIHHIDEFGIDLRDVNYLEILDCVIEYTGFGSLGGPEQINGGWRNVYIEGCSLSYNGHYYQGIIDNPANPYERPDGFGIEPSEGPIEICYTTAEHNKGDGLDSKAENTYIHHCVVSNNYGDGVKLWGGGSRVENVLICGTGDGNINSPWSPFVIDNINESGATFELYNVTISDNPLRQSYSMYMQYDSDTPIDVTIRNCIFANSYGAVYAGDSVDLTIEYCHFYRPNDSVQLEANGREYTTAQIAAGQAGQGHTTGDPLIENPAWGTDDFDFHLQETSSAVDSGTSSYAPSDDLENTIRPQGEEYDKGCYERAGTVTPPPDPDPEAIIIDHNCADVAQIPAQWINAVKNNSILHYARRSHGSQLNVGAEELENQNSNYAYHESYCSMPSQTGGLRVWNGQTEEVGDYIEPAGYWATPYGLSVTRSILNANPSIKYTMWSWCTELDYWTASEVNAYLSAISALETEFPAVKFIYMTGNAQSGGSEGWNRYQRNEQIRQYCRNNNKILYDFADLDSWYNGVQATASYAGNTFQIQHSAYDGPEFQWTHVNQLSCTVKAKALWWLMARLEGWDGE